MVALMVGILFLAFTLYSVLPFPWAFGWWDEVLLVLKGFIPLIGLFVGIIAVFIGIADLKDRAEAKKEESKNPGA